MLWGLLLPPLHLSSQDLRLWGSPVPGLTQEFRFYLLGQQAANKEALIAQSHQQQYIY